MIDLMPADSHCHLDLPELADDLPQWLALMQANDVGCALCIGVNLEDLPRIPALAQGASADLRFGLAFIPKRPMCANPRSPSSSVWLATPKSSPSAKPGSTITGTADQPEWQRERFRIHIRGDRGRQAAGHS